MRVEVKNSEGSKQAPSQMEIIDLEFPIPNWEKNQIQAKVLEQNLHKKSFEKKEGKTKEFIFSIISSN